MATKGYTTKNKIENYMLITIDASFNTQVEEWIAAVEEYMDNETHRELGVPTASAEGEYRYDGNDRTSLMIDDFVSISKVEYDTGDDTEEITDDVFIYPSNKTPKWELKKRGSVFYKDLQNVIVTGVKGYCLMSNFPKDLELAATVFVAGIINQGNDVQSDVGSETIGRYTVTYINDTQKKQFQNALNTLKRYKRIR